jgi:putative transposase
MGDAFVSWCEAHGILIDYIEPGKPNQNAYIERFNRSYRDEVLDTLNRPGNRGGCLV